MNKSLCAALILSGALLQAAAVNDPAPKFALPNQHNGTTALSNFKGKVLFINFWASWCGPCQEELPALNQMAGDYKGKKVRVVAINVDQDRKEARALLAKLALPDSPMEILWDTKSKAVSSYNIESMPSSFVIDEDGVIRFVHVGFRSKDPDAWRQEIDQLLSINSNT